MEDPITKIDEVRSVGNEYYMWEYKGKIYSYCNKATESKIPDFEKLVRKGALAEWTQYYYGDQLRYKKTKDWNETITTILISK